MAVRQALLDEALVDALANEAFDTSVAQRAASSFPEPLDAAAVLDVPCRIGALFVHADDQVMTPFMREYGLWEPAETAFLERTVRPGDTVLDVGANIGYFSVLGSTLVGPQGRVIAVEPEPRNLLLLKANLWRNQCANAVVLPLAAGREFGYVPLTFNEENRGDHQVGWIDRADLHVPSARLDDLLAGQRLDLVKVDTQGVDHEVVAGLAGLFEVSSPTILCEFWLKGMRERGLDPDAVARGYEELGFALQLLDDSGEAHPLSPGELVQAARTHPAGFVNAVLTRRT
jgi:FkbM family methyltransferase